jgi:hypothetical protein
MAIAPVREEPLMTNPVDRIQFREKLPKLTEPQIHVPRARGVAQTFSNAQGTHFQPGYFKPEQ